MFKPTSKEGLSVEKELLESNSELLVTLTLSGQLWKEALVEAKANLSKGAKVPGFRAGKAPSFLSSRDIPQERLLREALGVVEGYCQREAASSIEGESHRFSAQPRLEVKELTTTKLTLALLYPYFPDFPIPTFSPAEGVRVGSCSITREDVVVSALNLSRPLGLPTTSSEASEVALHDAVNIDFEVGLVGGGGEESDPNSGSIEIVIGSGMLLPAVERELVGMRVGQEGRFELTFPEFYPKLDFRSKPGYFKVKVLGIKRGRPPLIKPEDLPRLGFKEGATYQDLNAQLERVSQASKVDLVRNLFRRDLLAAYLPKIDIKLSEYQVLTSQRYMLERFLAGLEGNGITLEEYLRDTGGSKESIFEELRGETIKSLKTQALLERLIEREGIRVSEEEVASYRQLLASFYNRSLDEVAKSFSNEQISSLVIDQKLLGYLMSACDPEGAEQLRAVDYFLLTRKEGESTTLEQLHSSGSSLFNLYPLPQEEAGEQGVDQGLNQGRAGEGEDS